MPSECKPSPRIQASKNVLTNGYKPKAYIRDFAVFEKNPSKVVLDSIGVIKVSSKINQQFERENLKQRNWNESEGRAQSFL